ncbi:hypothetical protein GCK72_008749 [Caenorhabditis remanei]|uniref:F-box domain-containing protein n=1 Tax=Caenorhabditis remanei TaxID=31234 RepID=A0A6A5GZJ4_CAERE|nr:hypothetical protein GCK72_008746 [Caenorhabditis remanei]XP_053586593.1 hypothetical protein GCK72_008749 [Caenorhabditis remanei]KAF1760497.1 hypothetical protein GCK72_008746 [Caenorhabditis remanei]KAF1760500.1 hypothetical protein GCK72_008749 [Caenorhabditis remanei]
MEPTFPLFRLPENAILEVIKYLAIDPLFEFSLISTKTKNISTSLGITAQAIRIAISRDVGVTVYGRYFNMNCTFYNDSVDALIHLDSNQPISAHYRDRYEWRTVRSFTPLFSFNNWLDHIKTVFCYNKPPNVVIWDGNERFEMKSLKNVIKSANRLALAGDNTEFRCREILEHFKNANELDLGRNPFEEACEVQKFFMRNFESIVFHDDVSLDDMLLVNSKRVELYHSISQKQFNRFLKHWIRGSNPRLQFMHLFVDITDSLNGEIYLKGIRCMKMSEDAKGEIRQKHRLSVSVDMIQIRRKDGTTAVIGVNDSGNILRFIVLH